MSKTSEEDPFAKIERLEKLIEQQVKQIENLTNSVSAHQRLLQQMVTPQPETQTANKPQNPASVPVWVIPLIELGKMGIALLAGHARGKGTFTDDLKKYQEITGRLAKAKQNLDQYLTVPALTPLEYAFVNKAISKAFVGGGGKYTIKYLGKNAKGETIEENVAEIGEEEQRRLAEYVNSKIPKKEVEQSEHRPF